MTPDIFEQRRNEYVAYLRMKVELRDWHGVSDAANDLRELEATAKALHLKTDIPL